MKSSISVFIPCFNDGHHIENRLMELCHQSVPPLEVLIWDDGSTDDSIEKITCAIRKVSPHFPVVVKPGMVNMGSPASITQGMPLLTGDYVFIHAADNELRNTRMFENATMDLECADQVAYWVSQTERQDPKNGVLLTIGSKLAKGKDDRSTFVDPFVAALMAEHDRLDVSCPSMIWNRSFLTEHEPFRREFKWYADWYAAYLGAFTNGFIFHRSSDVRVVLKDGYYANGVRSKENIVVIDRLVRGAISGPVGHLFERTGVIGDLGLRALKIASQYLDPVDRTWAWKRAFKNSALRFASRHCPRFIARMASQFFQ